MKIALALAAPVLAFVSPSFDAPVAAPVAVQQEREKPAPPDLYDESADGAAQIAAAVAEAKVHGTRVLVQWGAEWCGWCHWLHQAFTQNQELSRELLYEYEVVHIDIGNWDKHLDLAEKLGAGFKGNGVPYLTILDEDGRALVNTVSDVFECEDKGDGLRHDPKRLLAFLETYQAKQRDSAKILGAALTDAKKTGRNVLLTFGAPWCGWCHRFEDWARSEAVAPVLGKSINFTKIDVERTVGGAELLAKYRGPKELGIPWFCFLAADGSVLATSTLPDGKNLGCPWSPEEKAVFDTLLAAHAPTITSDERAAMLALLGER